MNILLVNPKFPDALKFISKKSNLIPLGLITVSALLPDKWNKKLKDMNVTELKDDDIAWADFVMISAMSIQLSSVKRRKWQR